MNTLDIEKGERLLKASEIALMLKISKAQVYRLIQRGEIPFVRIGHMIRIIPGDLREYAIRSHSGYSEEWS